MSVLFGEAQLRTKTGLTPAASVFAEKKLIGL